MYDSIQHVVNEQVMRWVIMKVSTLWVFVFVRKIQLCSCVSVWFQSIAQKVSHSPIHSKVNSVFLTVVQFLARPRASVDFK